MSPDFEQLTSQKAGDLVNKTMAFTGLFADRIKREIYTGNPDVFVTTLPPVELHRKIGPFKRRTRVRFQFIPRGNARLEFGDREGFDPNAACRLDTLTQEAIVVIVPPNHPGAELVVNAGPSGEIINAQGLGQGAAVKQIFIWLFKVIDPAKMVGWYDPGQLVRTGVEVFFSTLFGRHSDYRLMEALTPIGVKEPKDGYYDFTRLWKSNPEDPLARDECYEPKDDAQKDEACKDDAHTVDEHKKAARSDDPPPERKEIWIDYVGDVGDGWNSTYAVAHCLAQPTLPVQDASGQAIDTVRGDILIFGGDQVYPIANRQNYAQRLLGPYETALDETSQPHPHAFAIPGNHDWYDSLVSFTRLFCQRRWFAGWQTDQSRSYFALKLPGKPPRNWWILGTDVQLDSDIDVPQVNFFNNVAKHILPGDRVIICTAEPHWVYAALYGKNDTNYNENNLAFIEKKVIPKEARVVAFIAGDQHHYRRYEDKERTQKITAGGGGAFLHPTHGEQAKRLPGDFTLRTNYPDQDQSKRLGRRNFLFLRYNFWFGVLTAAVYLMTAWSVMHNVGVFAIDESWPALKASIMAALVNPFAVFWIVAAFAGFLLFTDTHSRLYRWIAGPLHGLAHLIAIFLIGWAATRIPVYYLDRIFHDSFQSWPFFRAGFQYQSFLQLMFAGAFIVFFGWIVGSTIMGIYLYISLNLFGRHANEAFSSLAIQGWKNFLRMKIDKDGQLTIYPIGLKTIPGKWKRRTGPARRPDKSRYPDYEPDNQTMTPILIEEPIPLP